MIGLALRLLRDELSNYAHPTINDDDIILHNVAMMESDDSDFFKGKIVLSLVNIEEESALKNGKTHYRDLTGIRYAEPPVHLNLYVLISSVQKKQDAANKIAYREALHRLSTVVQFFQSKRMFTYKNSPHSPVLNSYKEVEDEVKLHVELYTLTFEQINHLWGSLGGKQVPFVMYKIRLVRIQDVVEMDAPLIQEIRNDLVQTNAECDE